VVVQRGCAKWSARVITNWLLILNTPVDIMSHSIIIFDVLYIASFTI